MSAYVVNFETINRVVDGFLAVSQLAADDWTDFGRSLLLLNQQSVAYRYCEDVDAVLTEMYAYKPSGLTLTSPKEAAQLMKSMKCFLYQCSEGEFDKHKLFEEVESALQKFDRIKSKFVFFDSYYEVAEWC